jgi:hypothetical protein
LKAEAELEPFVRLIEALEPWLEELVLIGGWAHRLYRLAPRRRDWGMRRSQLSTAISPFRRGSKPRRPASGTACWRQDFGKSS